MYVTTLWDIVDISLTVHSRAILKIVKSMCNGIKKSNARIFESYELTDDCFKNDTTAFHYFVFISMISYRHFDNESANFRTTFLEW
jgi:hypothetical protein